MSHKSRGVDPRIERSRRRIRQAALAELAAAGYGGFSLESVAARAGVGRSTVYRHWDGKLSLIADALETLNQQPSAEEPSGTPRERVEILLRHLAAVLADSPFVDCLPALVHAAEQDPTVRDFLRRYSTTRRQSLVTAIADGVGTGEFPATVIPELAADALSGALFYRRLVLDDPVAKAEIPALADAVLGHLGHQS